MHHDAIETLQTVHPRHVDIEQDQAAFARDPTVAQHRERLDGTGYPSQLRGDQIPVAARMMAIADIYDALTAKDRPYKKAIPVEKALAILSDDVQRGQLDRNLFDIFCAARVWTLAQKSERK